MLISLASTLFGTALFLVYFAGPGTVASVDIIMPTYFSKSPLDWGLGFYFLLLIWLWVGKSFALSACLWVKVEFLVLAFSWLGFSKKAGEGSVSLVLCLQILAWRPGWLLLCGTLKLT